MSATPTSTELTQTDEAIAALERNGVSFTNTATRGKTKKGKPKMAMRIDIPNNTPTRTISAVTSMLWEDLVNNPKKEGPGEFINRKKIQCAEKMIRGAFVELYRGLGLLKTYRSAFMSLLAKFGLHNYVGLPFGNMGSFLKLKMKYLIESPHAYILV